MIKTYVYIDVYTGAVYTGAVYTGAWGRRRPRLRKCEMRAPKAQALY